MEGVRYWILLYPDIASPIGGIKQIHRLAEAFLRLGKDATIVQENKLFHPKWFKSSVKTISLNDWLSLKGITPKTDVIIMPETFIPLITRIKVGIPKIIFNQNGSYSFGPKKNSNDYGTPINILNLDNHPDLIHTLCVSKHDYLLLTNGFGIQKEKLSLLINAIETNLFFPKGKKKPIFSFMPRKNERDSLIVTTLLKNKPWFEGWQLQEIKNLSQADVIASLQRSLCFLSFGHPEGFGLPLAEAAACGCALIGYTGLGGREIFNMGKPHNLAWNVEFGDWQKFIDSAQELITRSQVNNISFGKQLTDFSNTVRKQYTKNKLLTSLEQAIKTWESYL